MLVGRAEVDRVAAIVAVSPTPRGSVKRIEERLQRNGGEVGVGDVAIAQRITLIANCPEGGDEITTGLEVLSWEAIQPGAIEFITPR